MPNIIRNIYIHMYYSIKFDETTFLLTIELSQNYYCTAKTSHGNYTNLS